MKMDGEREKQRPTGGHGGGRADCSRPRIYHASPFGLRTMLTFTPEVGIQYREERRCDRHRGQHKSQLSGLRYVEYIIHRGE